MLNVWQAVTEQFEKAEDFALAVILSARGSSPRHVGARFLVRKDRSIVGTIGGGTFEARVQELAVMALEKGTSLRALFTFTGPDATSADMICGGDAQVLVEHVDTRDKGLADLFARLATLTRHGVTGYLFTEMAMPVGGEGQVKHLLVDDSTIRSGPLDRQSEALAAVPDPRLLRPAQFLSTPDSDRSVFLEWLHSSGTVFIFGAGHVGRCVAHLAAYVDFKVVVIDDREEFLSPDQLPDADRLVAVDIFDGALKDLDIGKDSYLVIVTRGHLHDKTVLQQAIHKDVAYLGMIGSRRKTALIFQALLGEGVTSEELARVHSPIGLQIGGETPNEIAVSIVAEMIQTRHRKDPLDRPGSCPETI